MMKVYYLNEFETDDILFLMKCFRNDIFIDINGEIYNIFFIEKQRFISELNNPMDCSDIFIPDINTIVLKSVEKSNIIKQLSKIGESTIRCCMKPCAQDGETVYLNLTDEEKKGYLELGWRISFEKKELKFITNI